MDRIIKMIDAVIKELKSKEDKDCYSNTLKALEKIKSDFMGAKEKSIKKRNDEKLS